MAEPATLLELKTVEDYLALPDDGTRYELIAGEIVVSPAPNMNHQYASMQLGTALNLFVRSNGLGYVLAAPFDVRLSAYSVVQPDILFVSKARSHVLKKAEIVGAPDLVIEIVSPSSRTMDLRSKANLYMHAGVAEYWIVDPDSEAITVYELANGGYVPSISAGGVARSKVLPGFEVRVADVFADAE